MKKIRHLLEYIPVYLLYRLSRIMGFRRASNLGGFIGRHLGYRYALARKVAYKNLSRVFPEKTNAEKKLILRGAAENLGRTFFEYFVLDLTPENSGYKCQLINFEKIIPLLDGDRPIMIFSAHIANWEIGAKSYIEQGMRSGNAVIPIYRSINNPYVDALILRCRGTTVSNQIPKGRGAGVASIRALKSGKHIVVLADQKYNEGPDIPFFGHAARTPDGFVKLAIAANALLIPVVITRHNGTEFTVHYSMDIMDPSKLSVHDCLVKVNTQIEDWIKANPEQWFWFHRRWDKKFYKD